MAVLLVSILGEYVSIRYFDPSTKGLGRSGCIFLGLAFRVYRWVKPPRWGSMVQSPDLVGLQPPAKPSVGATEPETLRRC